MSTKGFVGIFLFYLDFELFEIVKKDLVSTHPFFSFLLIAQDINKIRKIPHIKISAKNIKLYGSWSPSKFSIFQTKILVSWK